LTNRSRSATLASSSRRSKRGWVILDGYSANAILKVYEALNETNQTKFATLPLIKMAAVAFKLVK
jgi:hypothetical protein